MAIDELKTTDEQNLLFVQLAEPFDTSEIKWRVTHANRDASRGAVIAYADPRAYTDRLNELFSPTGWTRSYEITTVSAVTRMKKGKLIQTGKVLVTCTLTIAGLGCHSGSGEEWADEDNAMTTAEGQPAEDLVALFHQFCEAHGGKVDRIGRFLRMMEARSCSAAARPCDWVSAPAPPRAGSSAPRTWSSTTC